jgi:hypothetical protein
MLRDTLRPAALKAASMRSHHRHRRGSAEAVAQDYIGRGEPGGPPIRSLVRHGVAVDQDRLAEAGVAFGQEALQRLVVGRQ